VIQCQNKKNCPEGGFKNKIRKGVAGRTVYQANLRHVIFAVETGREGV
jgi:hypothetical protein